MGNSWSFVPNDKYKSSRKIIHMLTDIISKNGNLLLNIGPGPDGEWDPIAYERLQQVGKWMKVNSEAVYDTEADPNMPKQGNWVFTKKGNAVYAIYQVGENEVMTGKLNLNIPKVKDLKQVQILGSAQKVSMQMVDGKTSLLYDTNKVENGIEALVFKLNY
jgi:alpha-L-fucosidase